MRNIQPFWVGNRPLNSYGSKQRVFQANVTTGAFEIFHIVVRRTKCEGCLPVAKHRVFKTVGTRTRQHVIMYEATHTIVEFLYPPILTPYIHTPSSPIDGLDFCSRTPHNDRPSSLKTSNHISLIEAFCSHYYIAILHHLFNHASQNHHLSCWLDSNPSFKFHCPGSPI